MPTYVESGESGILVLGNLGRKAGERNTGNKGKLYLMQLENVIVQDRFPKYLSIVFFSTCFFFA